MSAAAAPSKRSTATAPRHNANSTNGAQSSKKLRVIDGKRAKRLTPMAVVLACIGLGLMFAAMMVNIALIDGQGELDSLNQKIVDARADTESLQRRQSALETPDEVLRIAVADLGMVEAAKAANVPPTSAYVGPVATSSDSTASTDPADPPGSTDQPEDLDQ